MKKLKTFFLCLVAGSWWLAAVPASQGHHSFAAQYDANKPVTLQGYVTKVEWYNPHVYFYIDVENTETGEWENWGIEMGPPHMLQNRGWKKNDMQIGDELLVEATRARDGSLTGNARSVKLVAQDKVLGAASSEDQTLTGGAAAD